MPIRFHYLTPLAFILAAACAENDLGVGVVDAAPDNSLGTGGTDSSPTGTGGGTSPLTTGGTVGTGGLSGGATGGMTAGTGGTGGAASGACGEATCLTSLFQTCIPEGSCALYGGNSPSAVFSDSCYANGVTVFMVSSYTGTETIGELSVSRNGSLCYRIVTSSPIEVSELSYTVTDGKGQEIAAAATADKTGSITVTCNGGTPTTVSASCLQPVSTNPTCGLETCPSAGGYDGGVDGASADVASPSVCDPLAPASKPITLGTVLGVGRSADGTIYVADQEDSTYRVFVSDASGALVRQRVNGSGTTSAASGMQYVFDVGDRTSPFVLQIEVPKAGATRMGVLQGTLTDRKSFIIGQDGEELTVLPSSAIASMPLRNLPGDITIEYVATLPDGQLMLVTRPTDDWTYADFRLFLGPREAMAERTVATVNRYLDGGTTDIFFDLDGAEATAHFPVVRADAGFGPGPATLTVLDVVTPLTRESVLPSANYLCL